MNRAEKRRLKRSDKSDSMLLTYLDMSDPCIVAALDDHGLSINEISEVLKTNSEYLQDYTKYVEIEGGFGMSKNEELLGKVKAKIRRCMEGKMNKAKALKILKNEFNLPLAVLSDLWIECKVDKNGARGEANIRQALSHDECLVTVDEEYDEVNVSASDSINNKVSEKEIVSEVTCGLDGDIKVEIKNKPTKWDVAPGPFCDRDEPVEIKKNNLTVLNRMLQVKGQYGIYTKSNDGVMIDSKLFTDRSMLTKNKNTIAEAYRDEIINIQKEIDKLITKLRDVENDGVREIEQLTEIEAVFDMSF